MFAFIYKIEFGWAKRCTWNCFWTFFGPFLPWDAPQKSLLLQGRALRGAFYARRNSTHLHLSLLCSNKDKLVIHLMWKFVPSDISPAISQGQKWWQVPNFLLANEGQINENPHKGFILCGNKKCTISRQISRNCFLPRNHHI